MLLDRQRPFAELTVTKTAAPMRALDEIARLWASGASMRSIAASIGRGRGAVAGLVNRARKSGDLRFVSRQGPSVSREAARRRKREAGRQRYRRQHPLASWRAPEIAASLEPSKPRLPIDLDWWSCRYATGGAPDGRHLFCGKPQAPGRPYCPQHCEKVGGGLKTGAKFVLRDINGKPR